MSEENPFLTTLPEDLRTEPSLATIKDTAALAKGYVSAQKLIGAKRLVAPSENWQDQQWNEFYDQVGRPKTSDEYKVPEFKFEEGVQLDQAKVKASLVHLHKLGLTQKQAAGVLEHYFGDVNEAVKAGKSMKSTASAQAEQALKQEWGDKFGVNVDVARSVIKKFGGEDAEEVAKFLDDSGLGNNVKLVRLFHKIGSEFQEDRRRSGGGGDLPLGDAARASSEIDQLKIDGEFQKALGEANHPGHRAAVDRWISLHQAVAPGKEVS